ncbi:hypothetical protein FRACA_10012 [Frankia canadensis]|uniref:Uncharacterized protein n=1 Tax=Frankia canadensis TaxID=1836972 RepID=A0A2I2KHX6_9ACTN|nr:hypothetical protein FRACA_10012 [Frankia canadensis]SOU52543.1 hypothetical protein FRACA_10012 [Frankia canadensis]
MRSVVRQRQMSSASAYGNGAADRAQGGSWSMCYRPTRATEDPDPNMVCDRRHRPVGVSIPRPASGGPTAVSP